MVYNAAEAKALLLSKEETLALLDMCLNTNIEVQAVHEKALEKLGDLARCYLSEEMSAKTAPEPIAAPAQPEHVQRLPEPAHSLPVRMSFLASGGIRLRLRSLPPVPEAETCQR